MSAERIWRAARAAGLPLLTLLLAVPSHALGAGGPVVQSMVVGQGGVILSGPRAVSASPATVALGGRHCAVAPATPLSVLAGLRRLGGPAFALRDYGRCGSAPRNSGQLFVYSIAGQANRGQSGWEYKVGGLLGDDRRSRPHRHQRQRAAAALGPAGPVVLVRSLGRRLPADARSLGVLERPSFRDARCACHRL